MATWDQAVAIDLVHHPGTGLGGAGWLWNLGLSYHVVTVFSTTLYLGAMIKPVRLDVLESCWRWFRYSIWFMGLIVGGGLFLEYLRSSW